MKKLRLFICRWLLAPRALDRDTADLVVRFSEALAQKLLIAQRKHGYTNRWLVTGFEWPEPDCANRLLEHLAKGDPRDVAAYCAFLWHFELPTRAGLHDVDKQERIVEIIYDFARSQQNREHDCWASPLYTPLAKSKKGKVSVNLLAVSEALEAVMQTFGHETVSIQ